MKAHALLDQLHIPPLRPNEFSDLRASIEANGLLHPVILFEGKILDGVHRARACEELGLEVKTREYRGNDPVGFIWATLQHRNLSDGQRSVVYASLSTLKPGRPKKNGLNLNHSSTIQGLAKSANVGRNSLISARRVLRQGTPELIASVSRDEIAVSVGAAIARLPPQVQQEIVLTKDDKERRVKISRGKAEAKEAKAREREAEEPKPLILIRQSASTRPAERSYSVSEWEALSRGDRENIIEAGFSCKVKMNDQPSDRIEWARRSLNTVTGCLHDCPYCYARDIAETKFKEKFAPTFHPSRLSGPSTEPVPAEAKQNPAFRNIFANSMSDLFGQWVPKDWIESTIEMARRNPGWNFLTLTKFPQRAAEFEFPDNWWMGTTVDAQARVANAEKAFAKIRCGTKWLSVEPLLEPLTFSRLDLFQWIVIGGASVSKKTPEWVPDIDWIVDLHAAARRAKLRIYYKTNCGMMDDLRVREFPWSEHQRKELPKAFRYLKGMGKSSA